MADGPLVRHEHLSQQDEELMRFMEGRFQLDFYCTDKASQCHAGEAVGCQLYQIGGIAGGVPVRS